ncbi:M50 family metallopeptidase [Allostreptomyces psammosilenae]|uniref:Peptidase M50B-like protein n=1 Tax=Allostreptomyces psammosilenae TaxID=1892865 RepID=A0A853A040_9ACTN|nr:M50 family metallopeptidase [Allostreptomyces psammosilenae]NYI06294.1 hypothetical protein [Allostreptomyces psammosilenae]
MDAATLVDVWEQVIGSQPEPPRWLVLATGALALTLVLVRPAWRVMRNTATIAHEGGHALVAVASGRRLAGIRLHSDTSGLTVSAGRPHGVGMVLTTAAGYPAPSLLGLGGAWLLYTDHITALLWITVAALAALLVMVRNAYGALSLVVTGGVCFAVSWFADAGIQAAFAYLAVWFLLFAGVRPILELQGLRRQGRAPDSDPDQLAGLTGVPAGLWVALFLAITAGCLFTGGGWLLQLGR